jgi:hypothetical protein
VIRKFIAFQAAIAAIAFAQTAPVLQRAPTIPSDYKLQCPAGTHQVGGVESGMALIACMKDSNDGTRVFHGPMVSLWPSGKVEAVGQVVDGLRSGRWTLYDKNGLATGETDFLAGDYHGRRVQFYPTGALKFEENWVKGRRMGVQKSWSATGELAVAEFRDDKPVSK